MAGKVRFQISMSLDGYAAGPGQSVADPLGRGGESLHDWLVATRFFHEMGGRDGGETGLDHEQAAAWGTGVGATIMGRNMFGPIRGDWGDEDWTGWWGPNPPYHHPVFVLTHHEREPVEMAGGTTFHFVTDGIEAALERAKQAANGQHVLIAGGANTAQQYLRARLIDEMAIHVSPVFLGAGERLFDNLDGGPSGYECTGLVSSPAAAHYTFARRSG
jgi:dihydrofolate reductase